MSDRNRIFALTPEQWERHDRWMDEVKAERLRQQAESIAAMRESAEVEMREHGEFVQGLHNRGQVYDGAIGGAYKYTFIPTSVGVLVKVQEGRTGMELTLDEHFG